MAGPKKDGDVEEKELITPDNPLNPPHLHGYSTCSEQSWFLRALVYTHGTARDDWHVMLDPIGFESEAQKKKWKDYHDSRNFNIFTDWHKDVQTTNEWALKIAVFNSWAKSWHRGQDSVWKRKPWRTWAAVLRSLGGRNRDLFIYDSEWDSVMEYRKIRTDGIRLHHLKNLQQRLVLYLTKGKGLKLRNIFIQGGPDAGSSTEKTGEFIRGLLTRGWILPIQWDADLILLSWYHLRQSKSQRSVPEVVASTTDKRDGFETV